MNKKFNVTLVVFSIALLAVAYFIWRHYQKFLPVMNPKSLQFITVSGH